MLRVKEKVMDKMNKVLIVEDDEVTSEHLKFCLGKQGYEVVATASDTLQARNKIHIYKPDVILLDISLDEESDGISLARFIRNECHVPFIYLSSHSEPDYIRKAQETKPYGYLVKPFEPNSLHTTIQMALAKFEESLEQKQSLKSAHKEKEALEKLLAHTKNGDTMTQEFGQGYSFNHETLELSYNDKLISLTKNEKLAMQLLLAQMGHTVDFETLISYVWEDDGATQNSVRTLIWRLRSKLPTEVIENASGQGYAIKS